MGKSTVCKVVQWNLDYQNYDTWVWLVLWHLAINKAYINNLTNHNISLPTTIFQALCSTSIQTSKLAPLPFLISLTVLHNSFSLISILFNFSNALTLHLSPIAAIMVSSSSVFNILSKYSGHLLVNCMFLTQHCFIICFDNLLISKCFFPCPFTFQKYFHIHLVQLDKFPPRTEDNKNLYHWFRKPFYI